MSNDHEPEVPAETDVSAETEVSAETSAVAEIAAVIRSRCSDDLATRIRFEHDLGNDTWYRVGGRASAVLDARDAADLCAVAQLVGGTDVPVAVVGKGSNLLVADRGFAGLVVRLSSAVGAAFQTFDADLAAGTLSVGAAWFMPELARKCAKEGIAGLEWIAGIPGTIGGAVRMNAGVEQGVNEVANYLIDVEVIDVIHGTSATKTADECQFGYRSSAIASSETVVSAQFHIHAGLSAEIEAENKRRIAHRKEKQETLRTAGSVWRNPEGRSAWEVIETAGCAGLRIGSAQISDKHANFIVTDKGGCADDVYRLMVETHRRVRASVGIDLHRETELLGYSSLDGMG